MKYIVADIDGVEEIFTFPNKVSHDRMAEALEAIRFDTGFRDWERKIRKRDGDIISAGFIDAGGKAYGRSETLNMDSRPEKDSLLYQLSLRK